MSFTSNMSFTNQTSPKSTNAPTSAVIARPDKPKIKYHKSKTPTYNIPPASYPHSATFKSLGGKSRKRKNKNNKNKSKKKPRRSKTKRRKTKQ